MLQIEEKPQVSSKETLKNKTFSAVFSELNSIILQHLQGIHELILKTVKFFVGIFSGLFIFLNFHYRYRKKKQKQPQEVFCSKKVTVANLMAVKRLTKHSETKKPLK